MKIYNYSIDTSEFISEGVACKSPLENGVYLIPANATKIAPSSLEDGYVNCFNGVEWVAVKDNRGTWYNVREKVEVTQLEYDVSELTKDPVPFTEEELTKIEADKLAAEAKAAKELALATLTVEVNGKVFDGNESSRNNMMSAIQAAELLGLSESNWKLADNTVEVVTVDELKQALVLAIQEVGKIVIS